MPAVLRARGWLLALAALLAAAAVMLPPVPRSAPAFEHVLVFDITQSMNVIDESVDGKPASRLDYARRAATAAIAGLPCGSRVGLGVFAKRRTLMLLSPVEVCANRYELAQAVDGMDGRMAWEQGSQVARGLYSAIAALAEYGRAPSLMFLTDGHESPPLDGGTPAFDRSAGQVRGAVLGIGGSVPQPIPRTDREGRPAGWWSADMVVQRPDVPGKPPSQEHLSSLREPHLLELARMTGLAYKRLDAPQLLLQAMLDPALARTQQVDTDVRWLPALLAGLLFIAFYLPPPGAWLASASAVRARLRGRTAAKPAAADGAIAETRPVGST